MEDNNSFLEYDLEKNIDGDFEIDKQTTITKEEKEAIKFSNLLESRKKILRSILKNIEINAKYEKGSYSLAVCGDTGSGKTYFIKRLEGVLRGDSLLLDREGKPIFLPDNLKYIHINTWKDDFLDNPVLVVGLKIAELIGSDKNYIDEAKKLSMLILNIAKFSGKNSIMLSSSFFSNVVNEGIRFETRDEFISELDVFKKYIKEAKKLIDEYLQTSGIKIFIIVDELDICGAEYVTNFLEVINHYFNRKGIIYIFSADRELLKSSLKLVFGPDFNFSGYLKKFFHYEVNLQTLDTQEVVANFSRMLQENNKQLNIDNNMLGELFRTFSVDFRDIEYCFRILNSMIAEFGTSEDDNYFLVGIVILSVIKTKKINSYYEIFNDLNSTKYQDIDILKLLEILSPYKSEFRKNKILSNDLIRCIFRERLDEYNYLKTEISDKILDKLLEINLITKGQFEKINYDIKFELNKQKAYGEFLTCLYGNSEVLDRDTSVLRFIYNYIY